MFALTCHVSCTHLQPARHWTAKPEKKNIKFIKCNIYTVYSVQRKRTTVDHRNQGMEKISKRIER